MYTFFMRLIFGRHGHTTGDAENRYGGAYDDDLSPEGIIQCENMGVELCVKGIGHMVTSPLKRARQTGDILKGYIKCPSSVDADIAERNQYGILTGMEKTEALCRFPHLVEQLKDRMNVIEGAQSYQAASALVQGAFNRLVANPPASCTLVVWHGGPMRVLFRDVLKWGELTHIGDCSWVELEKDGNRFHLRDCARIEFADR